MDSQPSFQPYLDPLLSQEILPPHSSPHPSSPQPQPQPQPLPPPSSPLSVPLSPPRSVNRGHWLPLQNKKYHWFLQIHYKHFVNRHMRRMDKIFKSMQVFIGTRQAEQCRSHHQKMEKKYRNFIAIIANLRQLHYNCLEIEPIAQEMAEDEVFPQEGIATIEEMKIQETVLPPPTPVSTPMPRKRTPPPQPKEQSKISFPSQQKPPQEVFPCALPYPANLLDDSNAHMGELLLYHQKEENSCLFPFFKHDL